jgi:hypothetical protein
MGAENLKQVDFTTVMVKEVKKEEISSIAESERRINKEQNIEIYSDTKSIKVTSDIEGVYIDDPPKQKLELLGLISFFIMILGVLLAILAPGTFVVILLLIAILLSIISLIKISNSNGELKGKGWAIAALILSSVFLITIFLWVLAWTGAF